MSSTVVLHVGVMKSGTTFVQGQLLAHHGALAARGVQVLGESWGEQVAAAKDVLRPEPRGRWDKLAARARDHDGLSLYSMEFLGPALPARVDRVVESLRPARVEVVVTARDLNRSIVALWQETIQNGRWWTWQEYVDGVRAARPEARSGRARAEIGEAGRTFWRQQDLVGICRSWAARADRVHLVTVPHPGSPPRLLLDRFVEASGCGPLELAPAGGNESIGAASTLALRRFNELLAERDLPFPRGASFRKGVLAKQVLAARRGEESRIGLPVTDWVRESAAGLVRGLQDLDVELVGEWADLDPVDVPGIDPADVPAAEVAEAAVAGLAGVVERRLEG